MKKLYILLGSVVLLFGLFGVLWMSAYNGYVSKNNDVIEKRGNVYATLSARYEKVATLIDAIEGANATVLGYLDTIMDAREAFADAIASGNLSNINDTITELDSTFITLVSYMEDNPSSYNTVNLYAGFMSEFSASTNAVVYAITQYNTSVTSHNNHIQMFPNNLFVGSNGTYAAFELTNYNTPLPTFN